MNADKDQDSIAGYHSEMVRYAIPALALLAFGCGSNQEPPKKVLEPARQAIVYFHVDPATAGTIAGKVTFHGAKPARALISMTTDNGCEKAHAGHPVYDEPVITGKTGTLVNAFVYIK